MWEEVKKSNSTNTLPRHALVEINNIYDEGLIFEPIHRLVLNCNSKDLLAFISDFLQKEGSVVSVEDNTPDGFVGHAIEMRLKEGKKWLLVTKPTRVLPVATLQAALNAYTDADHSAAPLHVHLQN